MTEYGIVGGIHPDKQDKESLLTPEEIMEHASEEAKQSEGIERENIIAGALVVAKAQLAKALKHRLDRPELRERILGILGSEIVTSDRTVDVLTDQILALIPDIEELKGKLIQTNVYYLREIQKNKVEYEAKIEEAKREERERICNEVERYFKYLKDEKPPIMIADTFELKAWWQALKEGK